MEFDYYQEKSAKFDLFELTDDLSSINFTEKVLGLTGEAGEVSDKVKKLLRDSSGILTENSKKDLEKELGDTLWYLASISRYLGLSLSDVAQTNLEKLESRLKRDQLHGSGDNR